MKQTEQEAAEQLIEQYYSINKIDDNSTGTNPYISRNYALHCAINDVTNTLEALNNCEDDISNYYTEYYQTVLNILKEKL